MANIAQHNVQIGAELNKLQKDLKKAKGPLNRFQSFATSAVGALGIGFGAAQLASFTKEAITLAGQAAGIEEAFRQLNQPGLLRNLQQSVDGTVSRMDLMKQAVRASNFKIPLDRLATFFKFATDRATQTGESVDYLVNSIINGIGRKSTLVMDNLGISASELQEEIKKVGDFGQASANIIERELANAGKVTDNAAAKTARLTAQFQNLKVTIGTLLAGPSGGFVDWLTKVIEKFDLLIRKLPDINGKLFKLSALTAALGMGNFAAVVQIMKTFNEELDKLAKLDRINDYFEALEQAQKKLLEGNKVWDDDELKDASDRVAILTKKINDLGYAADGTKLEIDDINDSLEETKKITESLDLSSIFNPEKLRGPNVEGTAEGQNVGIDAEKLREVQYAVVDFGEELGKVREEMFDWEGEVGDNLQVIGNYFTGFFEGFASAFTEGENVLKQFLDYFKKWAVGIIIQIAAIAAAAAVLSVITGGTFGGIFKGLFGGTGIGGVGQAFKGLGMAQQSASTFLKGEDIFVAYNRYSRNK